MIIHIFTTFPTLFESPFSESIIKRAIDKEIIDIQIHNLRDYTNDRHKKTDDYPYGGGPGMIMKPEPIFAAIESLKSHNHSSKKAPVILLSPQGRQFNQSIASELAIESELILICGHYEGVDERVKEHLATDEISIGDYILTGGELAAMILVDAVSRLIPGVLGSNNSASQDSFTQDLLEYPQYTRPAVFRGWQIPEIIKSGNHQKIQAWRRQQSILRTLENRPDLLSNAKLEEEDWTFLKYINELNKQSKTQ